MPDRSPLGFSSAFPPPAAATRVEWIVVQRPLDRLLRFTGRSIDDVVNSPIAKNELIGWFKVQKQIERRGEIVDLERQWNG